MFDFYTNYLLGNNNKDIKNFEYKHIQAKDEILKFIEYFDFDDIDRNRNEDLIDRLNEFFKNRSLCLTNNGEITFDIDLKRKQLNDFFDNQVLILEKNDKTFPYGLGAEISISDNVIFRLFNVGQACMSTLIVNDRPLILFDVGCKRRNKYVESFLRNNLLNDGKIKTIFISHYHDDHINFAKYLPDNQNLHFYLPQLLKRTDIYKLNVLILMRKIINNGNKVVFFINDSLHNAITISNCLTIYQGCTSSKDSNQHSNENSHGLVATIKIKNDLILVPGDVLYEDLFTTVPSQITPTYVIIPHHACKYVTPINPKILCLKNLKESFTFCGPNGKYHHPNFSHFIWYYFKNPDNLVRFCNYKYKEKVYCVNSKINDFFYRPAKGYYYDWYI